MVGFIELVQNRIWALHPAKLEEVNIFVEARLEGKETGFEGARNRVDKSGDRYEVRDGVAIVPVYGVINKRMNLFMDFSGGTSTELLEKDLRSALVDPDVEAIVLDVDSPGGSIDGTKEVADFIHASRGQKPIVAYANGMMASAAYWIGSAADAVVAYDTAIVGSIGVALTHFDRSARDERLGVKRTQIYAGKYKRIASDEKPLSGEGREYLQGLVDTYYSMFVESIARNRGADTEQILTAAEGKDYIGAQAVEAGLVNQIGNRESAISMARAAKGVSDSPRKLRHGGVTSVNASDRINTLAVELAKEKGIGYPEALKEVLELNPDIRALVPF